MASLNRVQLIGTLVDKPELRFTPSGRAVAAFTVSVENEEWRNAGYLDTVTYSVPIIAWGELGRVCTKYLQQGSSIYVEGYLATTRTELKSTVHDEELGDYDLEEVKYFAQLVARKIEFLENNSPKEPITGNKERIWKARLYLETSAYNPSTDRGVIEALEILESIDLETID